MSNDSNSSQEVMPREDFSYSSIPFSPQVSFTLRLNSAVFFYDQELAGPAHLIAHLIFCSTVTPPIVLEFFSLQHFDLVIINDAGGEVYRWSAGRKFPMIATNVPVFGEEHWTVDVTLADP